MTDLVVHVLCRTNQFGRLTLGPLSFPCALGRGGLGIIKHEGDGKTPIGRWRIEQIFWRRDRQCRPGRVAGVWPGRPLRADDGWCDAPRDANYNRHVRHPYAASAERLWRADSLYDFILVLNHNRMPRMRGRGSAIFLHVAEEETTGGRLRPTAGCVALKRRDLVIVLSHLKRGSQLRIVG